MTDMKNVQVHLGDWVSGTTVDDERIRGFVESVSKEQGSVLVRVTESDREEIIGRVAESLIAKVELLDVEAWTDEQTFHDLIDMALATKDEQWFMDLTSEFLALNNKSNKKSKLRNELTYNPVTHRRIWVDGI
jgi:enoyl reductase-like protein